MIDTEAVIPLVQQNAGVVRRMYPWIEKDDLEGVQWEWVYSNPGKVKAFLDSGSVGLLSFRLKSVATRYAATETEFAMGRDPDDLHVYNAGTVRELLKDVFEYENWQSSGQVGDGMPTAKRLANTTGDRLAMLADISRVMNQVTSDQYNALVWTYKYGYTHAQLAEVLDISEDAARMRVKRSVDKVVSLLMGHAPTSSDATETPTTGTRKVMTNAQARAITSGYTE